jgi:hypothetical protein
MMKHFPTIVLVTSLAIAALLLGACDGVDSNARIDPATAPSGPAFRPVAQVLVDRCGSIDCHGSKYRNMRLVGFGSTRLDTNDRPDAPDTTQAEVDQNYEAVTALEPDLIRQVVAEGGARPERLTFVRKARHAEAHKGGQRIAPGDDADLCILSWLAGNVDAERCKSGVPRLKNP